MFKIIFAPKRLIVCIITVAVCFSVYYVSDAINTSTDELSYYKQYTTARSVVWDHTIVDYDSYEEEYDEIGIDENDIAMLRAGYMDDEGAFTLEKLQQIKDIQPNNILETQYIISTIKEMFETEIGFIIALGDKGMVCLAFVFVLIPFIIVCKKRNYFIPIFLMVVAFCFYLYLWFFGRVPFRAVYVLWVSAIIYLFYSFSFDECREWVQKFFRSKKKLFLSLTSILLVITSLFGLYVSNVANDSLKRYQAGEEILELEQYIEVNSDKKFEIARCVNISISDDSVYSVEDKDIYGICETFSCTYYGHPNYKEEMKNFGTDNMYANLLNDGVYFVDDNDNSQVDMMRKYLQKYYSEGKTVECLEYQTVSHYCIYSFSLQ